MPETTHPSLLSRVGDPADRAAWRDFDARYRDLILRYGRRRGLQAADAEDVRQLVMISLSRSLRGFRYDPTRGRFRDYLGRVVTNAIHRHLARPSRAVDLLETAVLDSIATTDRPEAPELDAKWEREWMGHHYRLALEAVQRVCEPRSVQVFERLLEGASVEQAAQGAGLSVAAVHKIKQRLRDRLARRIAEQIHDEELPGSGGPR